jgi:IS1 family transposase/transposase-like protein
MRKPKDWGQPCPNPACTHYRRMQQGNVSAIATYLTQSGKRRIFRCHSCELPFSETRETVFFDLRTSEEKVMMALKMLLVRVDLAGIGFVLGVTEATVLAWLKRAAHQAEAINHPLLQHLPVTQVQLDEMWNFIARKHARETDEAGESLPEGQDGRQWIWVSFAPEFRWMIAAVVGPRTLETAKEVVAATKARVAGIPAFFSDGFPCYLAALIAAFHVVMTFAPTGKRGRPRKPVCAPHPDLIYGQLVKQKQHGKLLTLSTRVVLGAERLAHLGLTISTALVERVNLTLRQALAPLGRKTSSFCKDRERLRQRVVFFQAFYNVARPHMSLRQQLPLHERTRHGAICPRWRECTPAMAAGLTDHVWTFRELLTAKFEPREFQSISPDYSPTQKNRLGKVLCGPG